MASALAMDKWRTKLVWLASGFPTPRYRVVDAGPDWMRVVAELGLPLIVKPAREGSTIGITKVSKVDHDELALAYASREARPARAGRGVRAGQELTASIVNGRALPLIRIEAPGGNYDYHSKYFLDETKYFCPPGCRTTRRWRSARCACARSTRRLHGWGRLDLILRDDGTFSILE
jgi:D-alanine-D-alanine ligase